MKNGTYLLAKNALQFSIFTTLTCLIFGNSASAITLMQGATSVSTDMGESGLSINNIINQSGLVTTYTNGQDQATYLAGNPLHASGGNTEWGSSGSTPTGNIDFDLGAAFNLENILIWNEDFSGIRDFDLFASNVADFSTVTLLGSFTAPSNLYFPNNYPASVFAFTQTNARYVRMTVRSNHFTVASLGEVAFGVESSQEPPAPVPEPGGAAALVGLGLVGLGMGTKKKLAGKLG